MSEKIPTLPVIFKKHYYRDLKRWEILAFFPTLPWNVEGTQMTCYAHVGQHGGADFRHFWNGKKCQPEEYKALLKELVGIYTDDHDDPVELIVHSKRTRKMSDEFEAEVKRYRKMRED